MLLCQEVDLHIVRLHFLVAGIFCKFISLCSLASLSCLDTMDPKGKAPTPTPPYRQDASKGYLPSDDIPHADPEPSGYAPRSFLSRKGLEYGEHVNKHNLAYQEYLGVYG